MVKRPFGMHIKKEVLDIRKDPVYWDRSHITEKVRNLVNQITLPKKNDEYFIPRILRNDNYLINKSHMTVTMLGYAISKKMNQEWMLAPLGITHDLCKYKELRNLGVLFQNAEIIDIEKREIYLRPHIEKDYIVKTYAGLKMPVEINSKSIRNTLIEAGCLRGDERVMNNPFVYNGLFASLVSYYNEKEESLDVFGSSANDNIMRPAVPLYWRITKPLTYSGNQQNL